MATEFSRGLGEKLKSARLRLGLKLQEVAVSMGFNNYQTLSDIEEGRRQVRAYELSRLAKLYFLNIESLLDLQEEVSSLVVWRAGLGLDLKTRIAKEQEFLKYCHNYFDLEEKLNLDHRAQLLGCQYTADDFDFVRVKELAKQYAAEMDLGSRPACSLQKILEEKYNIKILFLEMGDCGSAASAVGKFGSAILINSFEAPWRRNYDLAHELFHIITWNIFRHEELHINNDIKSPIEKYADVFASCLLLPEEYVRLEVEKRLSENKISFLDLIGIAREFGVSIDALLWRLVSIRCFKEADVRDILDRSEIRAIDKAERKRDWGNTPNLSLKYVTLAFKVYQKGLISRGKLAEYLDVNRADLALKLSDYGYTEGDINNEELAAA